MLDALTYSFINTRPIPPFRAPAVPAYTTAAGPPGVNKVIQQAPNVKYVPRKGYPLEPLTIRKYRFQVRTSAGKSHTECEHASASVWRGRPSHASKLRHDSHPSPSPWQPRRVFDHAASCFLSFAVSTFSIFSSSEFPLVVLVLPSRFGATSRLVFDTVLSSYSFVNSLPSPSFVNSSSLPPADPLPA